MKPCSSLSRASSHSRSFAAVRIGSETTLILMPHHRIDFEQFAAQKTREAAGAHIERLSTIFDRSENEPVRGVGNDWSRTHYDGDFRLFQPQNVATAVSLVFVQSKNGNTGGEPSALGGGATDKHLIYEGLSRVAADAVLAGGRSVYSEALFSVWHPELIALRASLNLPRHPAQIVVSKHGRFNFDALLFNVPEVPVFVIAGAEHMTAHAPALRARPWIQHVPLVADDLRPAFDRLRDEAGIHRVSAIGGRFTATSLVDAGLCQDLYLTTTSQEGGEPNTPWYSGATMPPIRVITKKEWSDGDARIVFEHILIER
jgi:riboflavin biosynthesis pyrimidine reductase